MRCLRYCAPDRPARSYARNRRSRRKIGCSRVVCDPRAVQRLFDDDSLREELGRRGRELAESKLDWRFLAAGLEPFYEDTLARFR